MASLAAGLLARAIAPGLIRKAGKALGIGGVAANAGRRQASSVAGHRRRKAAPTAGKRKLSTKQLAALAKGRAAAKRKRKQRR